MNFNSAKRLVEKNQHLIGLSYNDSIIDELFIFPNNQVAFSDFIQRYQSSLDWEMAMLAHENQDCRVGVLLDSHLTEGGNLLWVRLEEVANTNLNVQL